MRQESDDTAERSDVSGDAATGPPSARLPSYEGDSGGHAHGCRSSAAQRLGPRTRRRVNQGAARISYGARTRTQDVCIDSGWQHLVQQPIGNHVQRRERKRKRRDTQISDKTRCHGGLTLGVPASHWQARISPRTCSLNRALPWPNQWRRPRKSHGTRSTRLGTPPLGCASRTPRTWLFSGGRALTGAGGVGRAASGPLWRACCSGRAGGGTQEEDTKECIHRANRSNP